jgi:glycosyltransferase involved in cell wall biosynthesis
VNAAGREPASSPPYKFLFLGRWHPNKGIDLLLDALLKMSDKDWEGITSFEIQGGGPLSDLVVSRITELQNLGRPVQLGTFLSKDESVAAISRADWVVIPSRIESIPLIYSDAMKCNRPVVATPVGDMGRLIQTQKAGIVSDGTEAEHILAALKSALSRSAASFMEHTQNAAQTFSIARVADILRRHVTADQ